jgi:hypothetical protein
MNEEFTTSLALFSGRTVYRSVAETREDGRFWLGGAFDEYDREGALVKRGETHWTGHFYWTAKP